MSFDWENYLLLAKSLNGVPITQDLLPAKRRTAVSRAYYAVFNLSKLCFKTHCNIDLDTNTTISLIRKIKKVGDHELTLKLLMTSDHIDVKSCSFDLSSLRGKRVTADYDCNSPNPREREVNDCIKMSEEIISALNLLKNGSAAVSLELLKKSFNLS